MSLSIAAAAAVGAAGIALAPSSVGTAAAGEVLITFEHGDIRQPIVIGSLWSDNDRPPESGNTDGQPTLKATVTTPATISTAR
jgi:uncharacterized protein involved in type VI secretion and phage assembly